MAFLAPLMLVGLAALALPVIIHLLDRTRTTTVDWPTLRFLKAARREAAQRARLKHLLVFLARCLLIALVVLAMSKPYRSAQRWGPPPALPQTLVIVIDNSYSMGFREGASDRTRFERAKVVALEQIATLSIEDEVAVILANESPTPLTARPTRDHAQAGKLIRQAKLSARGTDLAPAVLQAFALGQLDAPAPAPAVPGAPGAMATPAPASPSGAPSPAAPAPEKADDADADQEAPADAPKALPADDTPAGPDGKPDFAKPVAAPVKSRSAWRHVLLLTDMQKSGWRRLIEEKLVAQAAKPLPLTVVDLGDPEAGNRFVRQLRVRDAAGAGGLAVEVEIAGSGGAAGDQAQLWIDGQRAGSPELIPPGGGKLLLRADLPPPGVHTCTVTLDEDRLPLDDRAHLALNVAGGNRLTLVDGAPSDVPGLASAFHLDAALAAGAGRAGAVSIERLSVEALSSAKLPPGGCLALINVPKLDGQALNRVENYLRAGGNLWVCLGDRVDLAHYNRDWPFLPVILDRVLGDPSRARAYALAPQVADHPIFAGGIDLAATRYFSFVGADPTTLRPGSRILASFSNGSPAIVEADTSSAPAPAAASPDAPLSSGRVLLFTGGLDTRWSNLPQRRAFLPLVDRVVAHLTARRLTSRAVPLGQVVAFNGPATLNGQRLVVTAPDGKSQTLAAGIDPRTGQALAEYRDTHQVGVYRVQADDAFAAGGAFVVNLDTRESVLTLATADDVRPAFGDHPVRFLRSGLTDANPWRPGQETGPAREESAWWPWLLLAALAVFVAETLLANYFTRRRRPAPPPDTQYLGARRTDGLAATPAARAAST